MTESRSLIIKQELIGRLQQDICCSDSQETCRDGAFCSSDASKWPYIQNGHKKVRISYPQNSETEALPGTVNFCSEYMDWYTKSGCGSLAKEIAKNTSEKNSCPVAAKMDDLIDSVLRKTYKSQRKKIERMLREGVKKMMEPYSERCSESYSQITAIQESMLKHCAIMSDGEAEAARFNSGRADDLENIANFCMIVQKAEETKFDWKAFIKGGGAVGSFYIAIRTIRGILSAGKYISWAGTGLDTINHGIKHLFYVSIPNLKNTIASIFTGKKLPPIKTDADLNSEDEEAPIQKETPINIPKTGEVVNSPTVLTSTPQPHGDVVMAQFTNLANSTHYDNEGEVFSRFTQNARDYIVNLALQQWNELSPLKQIRLAADDSRFTEGKLPIDFLLKFSRRYLNQKMLPIVETSARVWAKRNGDPDGRVAAPQAHSNFHPKFNEVLTQLISNNPLNHESSYVFDYLTHKAINGWINLDAAKKESFITETDNPSNGALPKNYIRFMRKHAVRDLKNTRREAAVFGQILKRVPHLAEESFSKIKARSDRLIKIWNSLVKEIRDGFASMDGPSDLIKNPFSLPTSYIEKLKPSLGMGLRNTTKSIHVDKKFRGYKLEDVTKALLQHNSRLKGHPEILKNAAIAIIETWIDLPDSMKELFLKKGGAKTFDENSPKTISPTFIDLHAQIIEVIEIPSNEAPNSSGGGNGASSKKASSCSGIIPDESLALGGIEMLENDNTDTSENIYSIESGNMMFSNPGIVRAIGGSARAAVGNPFPIVK